MDYNLVDLAIYWEALGNLPVDDDGKIEQSFLHFPAGTDREDIWHWFEDRHPEFCVHKAMYGWCSHDEQTG